MPHKASFDAARKAITACEDLELPMILLTVTEKGNLNIITNVPTSAAESLIKVLNNAAEIIAQKVGN